MTAIFKQHIDINRCFEQANHDVLDLRLLDVDFYYEFGDQHINIGCVVGIGRRFCANIPVHRVNRFATAVNPLIKKPIHVDSCGIDDGFLQVPRLHRLKAVPY